MEEEERSLSAGKPFHAAQVARKNTFQACDNAQWWYYWRYGAVKSFVAQREGVKSGTSRARYSSTSLLSTARIARNGLSHA